MGGKKIGCFCIWDVSFATGKDRDKFEKKYNIKQKSSGRFILVGEKSQSGGFAAWTMMRNPNLDVIYFMRFMGYGDPHCELRDCLKEGIKIKFLAFIPINDKNSHWKKIRGRW